VKKMKREIRDRLEIRATCVSNDFLDRFMAEANGDYVKVYLYLLRHGGEGFSVKEAADALNLTDNDIKRAVNYWEKQGIYSDGSSLRVIFISFLGRNLFCFWVETCCVSALKGNYFSPPNSIK